MAPLTSHNGRDRVWGLTAQPAHKESALKQSRSVTPQIGIFNDRKTLQTGATLSASLRICSLSRKWVLGVLLPGTGHRPLVLSNWGGVLHHLFFLFLPFLTSLPRWEIKRWNENYWSVKTLTFYLKLVAPLQKLLVHKIHYPAGTGGPVGKAERNR